jgi:hypothetical protein
MVPTTASFTTTAPQNASPAAANNAPPRTHENAISDAFRQAAANIAFDEHLFISPDIDIYYYRSDGVISMPPLV